MTYILERLISWNIKFENISYLPQQIFSVQIQPVKGYCFSNYLHQQTFRLQFQTVFQYLSLMLNLPQQTFTLQFQSNMQQHLQQTFFLCSLIHNVLYCAYTHLLQQTFLFSFLSIIYPSRYFPCSLNQNPYLSTSSRHSPCSLNHICQANSS